MTAPLDLTPNQDGGILKDVKRSGSNPDDKPWKGDKVLVHYTGTLEDGTKFDSSLDRGEKFAFNMGKGEVIKGWDIGVASMCKGELAMFTIKPEYAYGDSGRPPTIPGGATLIFEVELFDFEGEDISKDKDKSVVKRLREAGEGFDHPNDGGSVTLDIKGRLAATNKVFDEREVTFIMGEGKEAKIAKGIEYALEKMKKNEKSELTLSPHYTENAQGLVAKEKVVFDIHLKTFERAKESWQLDGEQKLEQALIFKDKGTQFFKDNKFDLASNKYKKIVEFLEHEISLKDDKEVERKKLLQAGRLNMAICMLKGGDNIEARNLCDKVIEENPSSTKAFFRRGEAYIALNDHELAKNDFQKVLDMDPDNKAAKNKVSICAHQIKVQKNREKKTFANMFDKFAQIDAKKAEHLRSKEKPLEINEWEGKGKDPSAVISVQGDVQMDMDLNKILDEEESNKS